MFIKEIIFVYSSKQKFDFIIKESNNSHTDLQEIDAIVFNLHNCSSNSLVPALLSHTLTCKSESSNKEYKFEFEGLINGFKLKQIEELTVAKGYLLILNNLYEKKMKQPSVINDEESISLNRGNAARSIRESV